LLCPMSCVPNVDIVAGLSIINWLWRLLNISDHDVKFLWSPLGRWYPEVWKHWLLDRWYPEVWKHWLQSLFQTRLSSSVYIGFLLADTCYV
jgi:hypothetical protein